MVIPRIVANTISLTPATAVRMMIVLAPKHLMLGTPLWVNPPYVVYLSEAGRRMDVMDGVQGESKPFILHVSDITRATAPHAAIVMITDVITLTDNMGRTLYTSGSDDVRNATEPPDWTCILKRVHSQVRPGVLVSDENGQIAVETEDRLMVYLPDGGDLTPGRWSGLW